MHNRSIICAVDRKYTVKDIHRCIHAVMALTAVVLLLLAFAASSLLQVKADEEKYQYNNVDTGYEAVIEDDADIIDESNYSSLLDIMKQITVYGNVMLKTIDTNSTTTLVLGNTTHIPPFLRININNTLTFYQLFYKNTILTIQYIIILLKN